MFRAITVFLCVLASAIPLFAAEGAASSCGCKWQFNVSGGYSTVAMSDVNDDYTASRNVLGIGSVDKITAGWFGAGEVLYKVHPRFRIGPRVEYLKTNQGKLSVLGFEQKEDLSMVPLLIGGRYSLKQMKDEGASFCDNCGLNVGLFLGVGMAWGQLDAGQTIKYDGSAFALEALFGWEHRLVSNWMLNIDLGYRYAPVSEMKTSENYPLLGVGKGATIVDIHGRTLKYDFSGLIASVGIGYKF